MTFFDKLVEEKTEKDDKPTIPVTEKKYAERVTAELKDKVKYALGKDLIRPTTAGRPAVDAEKALELCDREDVIVGMALRIAETEILASINESRKLRELEPVAYIHFPYYRRKYGALIDEIWANSLCRAGDLYPFADKLYRLRQMNDLATLFRNKAMALAQSNDFSKRTIEISNAFVRIMDRINIEVGGKSIHEMIEKMPKPIEEEQEVTLNQTAVKKLLATSLEAEYSEQLPEKENNEPVKNDSQSTAA